MSEHPCRPAWLRFPQNSGTPYAGSPPLGTWKGRSDSASPAIWPLHRARERYFRDTRGLVRTLLGDREGAIRDFEAYISFAQNFKRRKVRRELIRLLRSDTPIARIFTPEVLKQLKTE